MSDDLIKIAEVTPSLKTRKEMISMIGPRLIDPSAKVSSFTGMFRFSEDKEFVEEILKARMSAINAAKFTKSVGGGLLAGGRGGRGAPGRGTAAGRGGAGRGTGPAASSVGGRVGSSKSSGKSGGSSTPAPLERTRSPKASPMVTPKSLKSVSSKLVVEEKQKQPEICPEETSGANSSPVSLGETDAETVGSMSTTTSQARPSAAMMTPVPEMSTPVSVPTSAESMRPEPVSVVDESRTSHRSLISELTVESPKTDVDTFTPYSCNTPVTAPAPTATPVLASTPTTSVSASSSSDTTSVAAIFPTAFPTGDANRAASNASPVPEIMFAARAPQRGPPAPTSRRSHHAQGPPSQGSNASNYSPVPTPSMTPNLSPNVSNVNLVGLGLAPPTTNQSSGASSALPSPVPVHVAPISVPEVKIGATRESVKEYIDMAPMVSDCPQIGIHALRNKFAGKGIASTPESPTSPKKGADNGFGKARKIENLTNAFAMKPATSTASSTIARSSAPPAQISIPGLSVAEMRAKFNSNATASTAPSSSSGATGGTPMLVRKLTAANMDDHFRTAPTQVPRPLVRRHSESITPANTLFAMAIAAVNAPGGSSQEASAGADLAGKCAAVLRITRAEFLALQPEPPINAAEDGLTGEPMLPQYSYREVVRRNFVKDYTDLNQNELEKYVCDADFFFAFLRSKVASHLVLSVNFWVFFYLVYDLLSAFPKSRESRAMQSPSSNWPIFTCTLFFSQSHNCLFSHILQAEYAGQARWKQIEQKKKAMLF